MIGTICGKHGVQGRAPILAGVVKGADERGLRTALGNQD